ncbi:hypothetical protein AGABI1DRAFT_66685 [Agaricus bisporus var. burnettii JB137-S8]|uniref:GYF domain-containing protein n=1 Tax=Agaricus bisporus var. burnettii (strain JB137-S8 / ATCC MYA-4627 / FGSC 10392) TaxID=597362 RepID=K5Y6G3_AGABU|nr:uncharacterized protein AGABI1DRAFT_66685 [Agaricus bisporus var. burnettii JB137-S8]EKM83755.1 hypothetical protein AGABI1DRAFT_66685 [Agaricus bisporus var. burnettii JB137-S8]
MASSWATHKDPASAPDSASVRSLPAVHIAEHPSPPRPSTSSTAPPPRPPSSIPHTPTPDTSPTAPSSHQQRGVHRRSTLDIRSNNRLSGFFTNLIHRREPTLSATSQVPEDAAAKPNTDKPSRTPSPPPPNPPPPSLPPPSLQELGLSLSVVTSDLSPNHFSTPPASGAFLAPHYLLLCHAQGLDVLPLTSPPSPQPYALVRRVAFKSVVVMEHRGVLVAVAGRRDGVRVYALEEVKKAIEWRIDVEIRRERERLRREAAKRVVSRSENEFRESDGKIRKAGLPTPPPMEEFKSLLRKASHTKLLPSSPTPPPPPLVPRSPRTPTRIRPNSRSHSRPQHPSGQPPPYASPAALCPPPNLRNQPSAVSVRAGTRSTSINHVLAGVSTLPSTNPSRSHEKSDDWAGSSDDEAIDIRAAAGGSQVLDERTSATLASNRNPAPIVPPSVTIPSSSPRRRRPSNLDLTASRTANIDPPEPSPTPTLLTLRQALQQNLDDAPDPLDDFDEEEDETGGRISLAQALMESRIPDLPPPGTIQPQEAILLSATSSAFQETSSTRAPPQQQPASPPKLEYVKLPGTKGAIMIKAVETPKKSFLAILCGENGEKVELFAGTYRTALGLSRTFILPDSPRSLELQLQGDDLVEVFLVFSQNVFGLEPATVRVREVRIGRAERRAARRRARELRGGDPATGDQEANEDDAAGLGVSMTVATVESPTRSSSPPLTANEHPDAPEDTTTNNVEQPPDTINPTDELLAVATAQMGPYTTFQQLKFTPRFPLASITDDFVIPPSYPTFLEYRDRYEPEEDANNNSITTDKPSQFSPPGLPAPTPTGPTQWYYKDPKGVTHGPWSSALMQAWNRDGLLPCDLPICREGETEYTLLKDLKLQCVDPAHPFRSLPTPPTPTNAVYPDCNSTDKESTTSTAIEKPLLEPISLLAQPKYFGPPALFFSSRGGHSTSIVDARGRSVLKSRFIWSNDDSREESMVPIGKMGDIKHLEAFDVKDRSILIAMRQGGLEAVDLNDALLRPADQSRTILPSFNPPSLTTNRRSPFVWKIGTPVDSTGAALSLKGKSGIPRKTGIGIAKSTTNSQIYGGNGGGGYGGDVDMDFNDDVLFLGRKADEIYFCERNAGSFRILKLCPDA